MKKEQKGNKKLFITVLIIFLLLGGFLISRLNLEGKNENHKREEYVSDSLVKPKSEEELDLFDNSKVEQKILLGDDVKDIDGNYYKTVIIGAQTWMAENLKVTRYNDGSEIKLVKNDTVWENLRNTESPAYCWYNNDINNKTKYGGLYNWYVVNDTTNGGKNVCPIGWHVPSDSEWEELMKFISIDQKIRNNKSGNYWKEIGKYLKSTKGWESDLDGSNGVDVYGFSASPSGIRYISGKFNHISIDADWWSSTSLNINSVWGCGLYHYNKDVYGYEYYKERGLSIRCIKN